MNTEELINRYKLQKYILLCIKFVELNMYVREIKNVIFLLLKDGEWTSNYIRKNNYFSELMSYSENFYSYEYLFKYNGRR